MRLTSSSEGHGLSAYERRVFGSVVYGRGEVVGGAVQQSGPRDDARLSTSLKDQVGPVDVDHITPTVVDVEVARHSPMSARVQLLCPHTSPTV